MSMILLFLAHLIGCFWNSIRLGNAKINWATPMTSSHELGGTSIDHYVAGIYWAFTTMTTVGYGDIYPQNDQERVYAIFIMLIGATVFGYIVGSVSSLTKDPFNLVALNKKRITAVTAYLKKMHIPKDTRANVRKTVEFSLTHASQYPEGAILKMLPIQVRRAVLVESRRFMLTNINFLRELNEQVVALVLE
eukprot:CAMPEP_0185798530 /NCGR_PEP_ID=MMETSP1174-20130828/162198_1 /TAXON_ID=35687 /ORGANISM="Dictyocha speculum, Strain CCMP1381" /LENGTH=191 /DNA_ID=CAMNT_0028494033 /DNA_START=1037 /DNA_END=1609 /DNA_ORIENTATION=-